MAILLLDTTTRTSDSFKSFVKSLENCKLNTFEHWKQFLAYNMKFIPNSHWNAQPINNAYNTRGVNTKICKALNSTDFFDSNFNVPLTIKIELDEGKLVVSGECTYWDMGTKETMRGTYRLEISFVEEMWTDDGHEYIGGKVIPITEKLIGC